jgi:hypothetical protein
MTYRPTVRYDERYRTYVDDLFQATKLDRNQIFRLSLFLLGHTKEGKEILSSYLKKGASLPSPGWMVSADGLWLEKTMQEPPEGETSEKDVQTDDILIGNDREEGRHEKDGMAGRTREVSRSRGEVHQSDIDTGGIRINVGGAILLPRRG